MNVSDKIRLLLFKCGNITQKELARRLGISQSNLSNKLKRNNFNEKDIKEIAAALDCSFSITFTLNDTGEEV